MGEPLMRTKALRALTAIFLTAVGLAATACTVYEDGPRHRGGWGFHDDGRRDHHRGWR
jgi:hypothetical protein